MNEKKTLTVKQWDAADKPREKMLLQGKKQLTNAELIAILLRSGIQGKNVLEVAKEILQSANNSLTTLSKMDYSELCTVKGLGDAKITTLMAALELGWRMQGERDGSQPVVLTDSLSIFNLMCPLVVNLDYEEVWAIYLNRQLHIIERHRISAGGMSETTVDLRIIFRHAIACKASVIAVVHNHPSGSLKPSLQDKQLTNNIVAAANLFSIRLLDHVIIALRADGKPDYYSFHDNGLV